MRRARNREAALALFSFRNSPPTQAAWPQSHVSIQFRGSLVTIAGCCKKVRPENAARMFQNPAPILSTSTVAKLLAGPDSRTILEVGAGCLRNALFLLRTGHHVSVLEVPRMAERFPDQYDEFKKAGGRILKSFARSPRFEIAILTFVVETICKPKERIALLQAVRSHLKPGGALVLSARGPRDLLTAQNKGVRCRDGYLTPNFSFARSHTRAQMERVLRATGFSTWQFLHKDSSKEPEYLHVIARTHDGRARGRA